MTSAILLSGQINSDFTVTVRCCHLGISCSNNSNTLGLVDGRVYVC